MKLQVAFVVGAMMCLGAAFPAVAQCLGLQGQSAPIICADAGLRAQEERVRELTTALLREDLSQSPGLRVNDGWREQHQQCHDATCARLSYDYRIGRLEESIGVARQAAWTPPPQTGQLSQDAQNDYERVASNGSATAAGSSDQTAEIAPTNSALSAPPVEPLTYSSNPSELGTTDQAGLVGSDGRHPSEPPASNGINGLVIGLIALISAAIYFLPSIVAFARGHAYRWVILAINLFAGWSLLGWVGPMVWAIWPSEKALIDPLMGSVTGTGDRNAGHTLGEADVSRQRAVQQSERAAGGLSTSQLDQLERLARLRDQGVLTDDEFAQQRAAVMV